mmetsp:Transcript_101739/g.316480  ORF Transcript_101739/g.316480 Transcript_101739/m.316480 type:complete len:396 (-) Transcript_101739:64-1251(-)
MRRRAPGRPRPLPELCRGSPRGALRPLLLTTTLLAGAAAERPQGPGGSAGALVAVADLGDGWRDDPRLGYKSVTKKGNDLMGTADEYKDKLSGMDSLAKGAKQKGEHYAQQLRELEAGQRLYENLSAELNRTVRKQHVEYLTTVREALDAAEKMGNGSGQEGQAKGLARPEMEDKFEPSKRLEGEDAKKVAGAVDATAKEDSSLKEGEFEGSHFRLELRWKDEVDLDLRMTVKGQNLWRMDKVMHVNFKEPCTGVFCMEDDQQGRGPLGFRVEVIYLRHDWRTLWGRSTVPNGRYSAWVQYYSAKPDVKEPEAPAEGDREKDVPYEASLFLGPEFGSKASGPVQVAACKGRLRWDDDVNKRTRSLFTFEFQDGKLSGLSLEEAPANEEPRNGWVV